MNRNESTYTCCNDLFYWFPNQLFQDDWTAYVLWILFGWIRKSRQLRHEYIMHELTNRLITINLSLEMTQIFTCVLHSLFDLINANQILLQQCHCLSKISNDNSLICGCFELIERNLNWIEWNWIELNWIESIEFNSIFGVWFGTALNILFISHFLLSKMKIMALCKDNRRKYIIISNLRAMVTNFHPIIGWVIYGISCMTTNIDINPLKMIWFCYNMHFPWTPAWVYAGLVFNGLTIVQLACASELHVHCTCSFYFF